MHVVTVIMPYLLVGAVMPFFFFCCPVSTSAKDVMFSTRVHLLVGSSAGLRNKHKTHFDKRDVMGGLKVRVIQGYPVPC